MGAFFYNIQLRLAGGAPDLKELADVLAREGGLLPSDGMEETGLSVSFYAPEGSGYLTLVSDIFDGDMERQQKIARALSDKTGSAALAIGCFDSDYLYLNLINIHKGLDLWASSGRYPDGKAPRRSAFAPWKDVVGDTAAFRSAMRGPYIFAEEALFRAQDLLDLPAEQGMMGLDRYPEMPLLARFFYKVPPGNRTPRPPFFRFKTDDVCYSLGAYTLVSVLNHGDQSRGVAVCFGGECLKHHQVSIAWAELICGNDDAVRLPLTVRTFSDGWRGLYGEAPEYAIPPAVPENMPPKKGGRLEFQRSIYLRFMAVRELPLPEGENPGDLEIAIAPLENPRGACGFVLPSFINDIFDRAAYLRQRDRAADITREFAARMAAQDHKQTEG